MLDLLRPYIPAATILAITCYAHIDDIDIKVQIVLFSSIVIAMDDPSVLSTPPVRNFHRRLCLGAAHDDPGVVGRLLEVLLKKWDFYPDFSSTSIFTSVSQFVNGCLLEQISGESQLAGSSDAMPFIAYRRNMSGLAEAFAYFIWDKKRFPHVEAYMQAIPGTRIMSSELWRDKLCRERANATFQRRLVVLQRRARRRDMQLHERPRSRQRQVCPRHAPRCCRRDYYHR